MPTLRHCRLDPAFHLVVTDPAWRHFSSASPTQVPKHGLRWYGPRAVTHRARLPEIRRKLAIAVGGVLDRCQGCVSRRARTGGGRRLPPTEAGCCDCGRTDCRGRRTLDRREPLVGLRWIDPGDPSGGPQVGILKCEYLSLVVRPLPFGSWPTSGDSGQGNNLNTDFCSGDSSTPVITRPDVSYTRSLIVLFGPRTAEGVSDHRHYSARPWPATSAGAR
jgi:hypothetical protein